MKKSKFVALVLIFALFFSVVDVKPARAGWAWELGKIFLVEGVFFVAKEVIDYYKNSPEEQPTAYAEPVQPKQEEVQPEPEKKEESSWWWPFGGEEKKTEPEPEKSWWWPF